jgi:hypothetical protein
MSGIIHFIYSKFIDPQDYDFTQLDEHIKLVEEDLRGLGEEEKDEHQLRRAKRWIGRRAYVLSFVLVILWPLLSVPAGKFTKAYFSFWVLVCIAWGFGAGIIITVLPLSESSEDILKVCSGMWNWVRGIEPEEYEGEPPKDFPDDYQVSNTEQDAPKKVSSSSDADEEQA